jgi:hypothetical protein
MKDSFEEALEKVINLDLDDFQHKFDSIKKIDIKKALLKLENSNNTDTELYRNLMSVKDLDFNRYQEALDSVKNMGISSSKQINQKNLNNNSNFITKKSIFISYSHKDSIYLERLKVHLKPLEKKGLIELWDDTKIRIGDKWEETISNALSNSAIAILIISADFLASDFIIDNELPPLLEKANNTGTEILPIILKKCRFEREESLSKFQALNSPKSPIINLKEHEQEELWDKLAERIEDLLN